MTQQKTAKRNATTSVKASKNTSDIVPDWSKKPVKISKKRTPLQIAGVVIATALVIGGLAFVGFWILLVIAFSSYGSNK